MHAHVIEAFGEPDVLQVMNLPNPEPGPGGAVLAIAATSVNPFDYKIGRQGPSIVPGPPAALGCGVVGMLPALEADVNGAHPRRAACPRPGASFEQISTSH